MKGYRVLVIAPCRYNRLSCLPNNIYVMLSVLNIIKEGKSSKRCRETVTSFSRKGLRNTDKNVHIKDDIVIFTDFGMANNNITFLFSTKGQEKIIHALSFLKDFH